MGSPVSRWKVTWQPSERPIQFSCINRTLSGHSGSIFRADSSSSAYSVIFRNHCSRFFLVTTLLQRQHLPSSTCSLASTVSQEGHQLTGAPFL